MLAASYREAYTRDTERGLCITGSKQEYAHHFQGPWRGRTMSSLTRVIACSQASGAGASMAQDQHDEVMLSAARHAVLLLSDGMALDRAL